MAEDQMMVSILVIVGDDVAALDEFLSELHHFLSQSVRYYEVVLIDNGSSDGTSDAIVQHLDRFPNLHFIRLSAVRNHEVAIAAAIDHCIGDYAVLMDIYLDPPTAIADLIAKAREGYDVVIAHRSGAPRPSFSRRVAYRLASHILRQDLQPDASYFRLFSRAAINGLIRIKSSRRSLKYFSAMLGYKQVHVPTVLAPRHKMRPRSSFIASMGRAVDLIISNSFVPLRWVSSLGFLASLGNLAYLGYVFLVTLFKRHVAEGWFTTSVVTSVMFLCLFIILAVLSEYVVRILEETQTRPLYFIEIEKTSANSLRNQQGIVNVV